MPDTNLNMISNTIRPRAIVNHQGLPVSSGFGRFAGLSEAKYGSVESENAIETLSADILGLAAFAINSFNSSKVVFEGKAFLSNVTAIEISSITPGFMYSLV